jgi:hypothetical protein
MVRKSYLGALFVELRKIMPDGMILSQGSLPRIHFKILAPKARDARIQVTDQLRLKRFVKAVISGHVDELPPDDSKLAEKIRSRASSGYVRLSVIGVCKEMSKLPGPWKGIAWATLRDNLQRPPGTRRRTKGTKNDKRPVGNSTELLPTVDYFKTSPPRRVTASPTNGDE